MNIFHRLVISSLFLIMHFPLMAEWDSYDVYPPMEVTYHPVSTSSEEAQYFFNKGLFSLWAFNHDEAYTLFQRSVEHDPQLAMGYWGMAYSLGTNINRPITEENEKKAYALVQKALELSVHANVNEKAYIHALSKRYSPFPNIKSSALNEAYKLGMEEVVRTFPDDLDAAVLYAESMMDLNPWRLWTTQGQPLKGTLKIVGVLESVLKRNPRHIGANHFYIHAVEASKFPEKALMSAHRLEDLHSEWGHILHMPSHIYILVGDYERAAMVNEKAVKADKAYIKKYGLSGFYPLHYMSHNLFFLCRSRMWAEQFEQAYQAAQELERFLSPHIKETPHLEYYLLAPMQVLLYFHRWEELLEMPIINYEIKSVSAFQRFARAMAFITFGNIKEAKKEQQLFLREMGELQQDEVLGYNSAQIVLQVASSLLSSQFAKTIEDQKEYIASLQRAVKEQDNLYYNEPPDWYYPIRQTLGAAYLEIGQPANAEETFREALKRLPRNGRSLFGLAEALKVQGKTVDLYFVEREKKAALKNASETLTIQSL